MAMARLVEAAVDGAPFPLFGDGAQVRDFTYVADVVRANLAAARADVPPGTYLNIAGGSSITVGDLIALAEELSGSSIELDRRPAQPGDAQRTGGAVGRAEKALGWAPRSPSGRGWRDRSRGTASSGRRKWRIDGRRKTPLAQKGRSDAFTDLGNR